MTDLGNSRDDGEVQPNIDTADQREDTADQQKLVQQPTNKQTEQPKKPRSKHNFPIPVASGAGRKPRYPFMRKQT